MWEKIKAVWSKIKGFVIFLVGAIISAVVVMKVAKIGEGGGKKFAPLKGQPDKIQVMNEKGKWEVIQLPKIEGKQVTSDKIEAAGVVEGGGINVKIKHVPVRRRG